MKITPSKIKGLFVIQPRVFEDKRGYFFESFNQREFEQKIGKIKFVQDNESKSSYGVLRGLHFQKPPYDQAKLVRCIQGEILDVVVDIRKGSPTFGRHKKIVLSGKNKKQIFIPRGFAHGYVVLSKKAIFYYKVDNYYAPEYDSGILYNDTELNIDWEIPVRDIVLSEKDKMLKPMRKTENPFNYKK